MSLDENLTKLTGYMTQFGNGPILHRINGQDVPASDGGTFETFTPVDMSPLATVAKGTAEDIDAACLAAKDAFKTWSKTSGKERKAILHRIADKIEERAEELAFLECIDTGQTLRFMKKAALRGADNFRFYGDQAPSARDGQSLYGNNQLNITNRVPLGPVAVITPWNTPFMLSTWKIAPALGAGCTVVHKPAEFSPLTARVLVEIAEEAGLPPGVWNMVNDDEVVFFEAFAPMILSHGSTFIDIWELLIGGVDNMSDLGATDNRERLHEAEERLSDLVTQFAQQNRM